LKRVDKITQTDFNNLVDITLIWPTHLEKGS